MERVRVQEASTTILRFALLDAADAPVPAASLLTATLTLVDLQTAAVLNGRDAQDVLNAHDVTIDSDGQVAWTVQPADNVRVTTRRQIERHRATFAFTWATGAYAFDVELDVVQVGRAA